MSMEVVASVTESLKLSEDMLRLKDIFLAPSLQMISFTLTEYAISSRTTPVSSCRTTSTTARTTGKAASLFGKLTAPAPRALPRRSVSAGTSFR